MNYFEGVEKGKYIISTAQRGAKANKNFLNNLMLLKEKEGIEQISLFVTQGTHKNRLDEEFLDKSLLNEKNFYLINGDNPLKRMSVKSAPNINEKCRLYYTQVLPQNVNPFFGYASKTSSLYSYIINGTKARFEVLPHKQGSPRFIMSTGSITSPKYREHFAIGQKAKEQHQFGAAIIEVINNKKFIPYQIVANNEGNFTHKNIKYKNGKEIPENAAAMVLGDPHLAVIDKEAFEETMSQIKKCKPGEIHMGDLFDGLSINHHDKKNHLRRLDLFEKGKLDFRKEIEDVYIFLKKLSKKFPDTKFFLTYDNHSQNIIKYIIEDKRHLSDIWNMKFSTSVQYILENNPEMLPLEAAIKALNIKKGVNIPKNVKFLRQTDVKRVWGWLVSDHGNKGLNGAKGSIKTYEKNNIKAILQHSHTPKRLANTISVGHLSNLKEQSYAHGGLTTWLMANAVINNDGTTSLLILHSNFKEKKRKNNKLKSKKK